MASAAVRSKAVVLFCLFIVAPIVVFCFGIWFLFCNAALSAISSFCNNLAEVERADCFTLIVIMMPFGCSCSVSLPRDAVHWLLVYE